MRDIIKKDREMTDVKDILRVIENNSVLRIALCDGDMPYIIPMNYAYDYVDDTLTFYFHSALKGAKLEIMEKNNNACFEIDCEHNLIEGKVACQYSFEFSSVVGVGKTEIVENPQEKIKVMKKLMKHIAKKDFDFTEKLVGILTVWKLTVSEFKGKTRKMPTV